MPVVSVLAPPLPQRRALLSGIADGIAEALALGEGDVVVLAQESVACVVSGGDDAAWVRIEVSGSARGEVATATALQHAEQAVQAWAEHTQQRIDGVWATWSTP